LSRPSAETIAAEGGVSTYSSNEAAFFDLDRTLMAGASAYHFGRASFKAGRMTRAQLARDGFEQLRFRLNGSTDAAVNVLLDRLLGHLKGTPAVETARLMPDALAGILPRIYPQMIEVVRKHQAEGRPCYIATAAGQEMASILATALVMEGAIGTRFEVDEQGMFSGRLEGPFAYGDGKARAVAEFADREGIDLSRSWAYSDSASDLPLLELVGHPVAVNPDAELAETAKRGDWEVMRFEKLGQRLRIAVSVLIAAAVGGSGTWLAARSRERGATGIVPKLSRR
jgi:HAD superfamily hydrolase (TIGR01490 family)